MEMKALIGDSLILFTAAFAIYLSVIMLRRIRAVVLKAPYEKIFCYELVICAVFLLSGLDFRFGFLNLTSSPGILIGSWSLRILTACGCIAWTFFFFRVIAGSFIHTEAAADYAIVLGLALENGKAAKDLLFRLEAAEKYMEKNPNTILILTGGNPDSSGRTEADVMRELLLERGIPEEQMILEDQAKTTWENFRNTVRLADPEKAVVLISSNYHMDRAVRTAKRAGFTRVLRLPARSSAVNYAANVMWEVILELNELKKRKGEK